MMLGRGCTGARTCTIGFSNIGGEAAACAAWAGFGLPCEVQLGLGGRAGFGEVASSSRTYLSAWSLSSSICATDLHILIRRCEPIGVSLLQISLLRLDCSTTSLRWSIAFCTRWLDAGSMGFVSASPPAGAHAGAPSRQNASTTVRVFTGSPLRDDRRNLESNARAGTRRLPLTSDHWRKSMSCRAAAALR